MTNKLTLFFLVSSPPPPSIPLKFLAFRKTKKELVSDADLDAALSAAVTCAVLAPPGPARTRILAGLGRDERAARLPLSGVLSSVRSQRLLTREDAAALDKALTMPHHRAVGGDGATVLERALREHNLSAAARVYSALTLEALGELLGLGRGSGGEGEGAAKKSAAEEAVSFFFFSFFSVEVEVRGRRRRKR